MTPNSKKPHEPLQRPGASNQKNSLNTIMTYNSVKCALECDMITAMQRGDTQSFADLQDRYHAIFGGRKTARLMSSFRSRHRKIYDAMMANIAAINREHDAQIDELHIAAMASWPGIA